MRLYSDIGHYTPTHRGELADVLKPFWNTLSDAERRRTYGPHIDRYRIVDTAADADVCVLPMSWNYYVRTKQIARARAFIEQAQRRGKKVATWVTGDFGMTVPLQDVYIFRASGYRSKKTPRQYALPVFIRDPVEDYVRQALTVRSKSAVPKVGFCGQADDPSVAWLTKPFRLAVRNIASYVGVSPHEPQAWYPPTFLRARALSILEKNEGVETHFIKRKKYKAGAAPGTMAAPQERKAFWDNIMHTDYTVCVRGSGNFSARFYEVLAMGRIPVFIDTDCLLPYEDVIDWKKYCVWVDAADLAHLPEKIASFHARLAEEAFEALQRQCRTLWENRLSYAGFFAHFHEHFGCTIKIR